MLKIVETKYSKSASCRYTHIDLFAMSDWDAVRAGDTLRRLTRWCTVARAHIESCPLCRARGHACELCADHDDILFPFNVEKVRQCALCGACAHIKCVQYVCKKSKANAMDDSWCLRCARMRFVGFSSQRAKLNMETIL